jgi:hypothetical protein
MKSKFRFLFVLFPVAFVTLGALITMGLWNWIMPAMFGLGTLTFLKALGILLLARILFGWKGMHRHGWHGHYAYAGSCGPGHMHRKAWMHHRWQNLTPEQREKFARKCGMNPDDFKTQDPRETGAEQA